MDPYVEVTGRRSARWALFNRMVIKTNEGVVYLDRLRLIQTPWFGLFLHQIVGPDPDPDPHDHPWNFWCLMLRGGYIEEFHTTRWLMQQQRWRWLSVHKMAAAGVAHRIVQVKPHTWTLIFVGRRQRDWGFWTPDGWVGFREYEACPYAKGVS